MSAEPIQLQLIEPTVIMTPEAPASTYSYREVKKRIPDIVERHWQAIAQAMPTLSRRQIPEQAKTLFGQALEKQQRDALGLSFEIRSITQELVQQNTMVAFYLRYVEERKLYMVLGYRSFKDYAVNYFNELEYSYLTRLRRIAYLSPQEIQNLEPLGTTKMMLVAQLDKDQRHQILDKRFPVHENEMKSVEDMSTRELSKVVQEQKNPHYKNSLIKGIPSHLMHQLRMLEENLAEFEREELLKARERMEQFLQKLNAYLG